MRTQYARPGLAQRLGRALCMQRESDDGKNGGGGSESSIDPPACVPTVPQALWHRRCLVSRLGPGRGHSLDRDVACTGKAQLPHSSARYMRARMMLCGRALVIA